MDEIRRGDNQGPKDAEYYAGFLKPLAEKGESWRDFEINEKNADQIAADIEHAASLRKSAEADRVLLVDPFLMGQRRVNGEFKPVIEKINQIEQGMRSILTKYLQDLKRRQAEEARKAQEEADRKKREAEALAADPLIGREVQKDANLAIAESSRAARARPNISGGGDRAIGLRVHRYARITDVKALVMHYYTRPEIVDAAEKIANQEIRAAKGSPVSIPGVEVIESSKA